MLPPDSRRDSRRGMADVRKQARAERDLREIWRYTFENWGDRQADAYLATIDAAIRKLAEGSARSADWSHVAPGLRRLIVRRHRIFCRVAGEQIVILRVLHEAMDVEAAVGED